MPRVDANGSGCGEFCALDGSLVAAAVLTCKTRGPRPAGTRAWRMASKSSGPYTDSSHSPGANLRSGKDGRF